LRLWLVSGLDAGNDLVEGSYVAIDMGIVLRDMVRRVGGVAVFGEEIAMGDDWITGGFAGFFGAVSVANGFEGLVGFAFEEFGVVFLSEFFGGLVTVFLEDVNLAGEAAEDADGAGEFFGSVVELLAGFGFEEELGEFGGDELEADFGELGGVAGAEVCEEIVLKETGFEGAVLSDAPVAIAAASFPVGDVAGGNSEIEFFEGLDDLGMRDVVAEHAVDHVTDGVRESGDFAVAGAGRLDGGYGGLDTGFWMLDGG
jgi:hypothetical protein